MIKYRDEQGNIYIAIGQQVRMWSSFTGRWMPVAHLKVEELREKFTPIVE